ncbi:MAG TPA: glycine--tRNA ligase subunit beta, partial [Elusimicrobiales bacterium]|nr:glycine--tRNA ligase subunit beta [Elusimicrobiales bacterium]
LTFPKMMVWEETNFRFARPIRNIAALCDSKVIAFSLAGVKSNGETSGLCALGSKKIKITSAKNYESILKKHDVILDSEKRRVILLKELAKTIKSIKDKERTYEISEGKNLIEETVYLTENPIAVLCQLDEKFMTLPYKLIATVLANHMKCFAIKASPQKTNSIEPYFIAVLDGVKINHSAIKKGYQDVAKARFEDAKFFYEKDLGTDITKMREKLGGVLFHQQVGTMLDKTERIKRLSNLICDGIADKKPDKNIVGKIADYCYADLTSQVVGEFPELQGYMGSVYAKKAGSSDKEYNGLEEFYYPLTADINSPLPSVLEGAIVSLADKIDTLVCNFALGFIPTGSEDPHGLRRQAMGIIKIMMERNLDLNMYSLLDNSIGILKENFKGNLIDKEKLHNELAGFIWERYENLHQESFKFDEFRAVKVKVVGDLNFNVSLTDVNKRLQALHAVRQDSNFNALTDAFKRVSNILKKVNEKYTVNPELFEKNQEKELFAEIQKLIKANDTLFKTQDYETVLKSLTGLKTFVDNFFDNVMVMVEDEKIKQNRLGILQNLYRLFTVVADLSQLQ